MDFAGPVARDHEPVQLRIRKSISRFNHLPIDLIPDSKIQRELRRWPPIILSVEVCPQRSSIGLASSDTDLGAGGITQKKIRERIAVRQARRRRRVSGSEVQAAAGIGRAERIEP